MPDLSFSYDAQRDELTVEGNKWSGDFFRFFQGRNVGKAFVLDQAENGSVWIRELEIFPLPENRSIN